MYIISQLEAVCRSQPSATHLYDSPLQLLSNSRHPIPIIPISPLHRGNTQTLDDRSRVERERGQLLPVPLSERVVSVHRLRRSRLAV